MMILLLVRVKFFGVNPCASQVTDLLGKYPDLMEEFNDFLERCENIGNCRNTITLSCFLWFFMP